MRKLGCTKTRISLMCFRLRTFLRSLTNWILPREKRPRARRVNPVIQQTILNQELMFLNDKYCPLLNQAFIVTSPVTGVETRVLKVGRTQSGPGPNRLVHNDIPHSRSAHEAMPLLRNFGVFRNTETFSAWLLLLKSLETHLLIPLRTFSTLNVLCFLFTLYTLSLIRTVWRTTWVQPMTLYIIIIFSVFACFFMSCTLKALKSSTI